MGIIIKIKILVESCKFDSIFNVLSISNKPHHLSPFMFIDLLGHNALHLIAANILGDKIGSFWVIAVYSLQKLTLLP
jgi:hypothetical protein